MVINRKTTVNSKTATTTLVQQHPGNQSLFSNFIFVAALTLLFGCSPVLADVYDVGQPPPFYTDTLPYCSLQRTVQGSYLTFPLLSETLGVNASFIYGTIQMAARSESLVATQPLTLDGRCGSYVINNGSIVESLNIPDRATCGAYLVMCVPNGTTNNFTSERFQLPVTNKVCSTCAVLPFLLLRIDMNRLYYADCGYPMSLVCTSHNPSKQIAQYTYAAVNRATTASAYGKNWTRDSWPGPESITIADTIKNYSIVSNFPISVAPYVVNSPTFNQTAPLVVGGPNVSNATVCTIYNTITFISNGSIAPGVAIPNVTPLCDAPVALAWSTIDLVTSGCQLDLDCLGFTTKINSQGLTVVDCLMQRATPGFGVVDTGVSYRRIYFEKTPTLECKTIAGANGNLTIYAVTSVPVVGRYDIYANDVFVKSCSIAPTLTNCNAVTLCANIQVLANTTVRVVPNQQFYDTTCGFAARVVTLLQSPPTPPLSASFVAPALPAMPYSLSDQLSGYTMVRRFEFSASAVNPTAALFYLNHVANVYIVVWQSGYRCPTCASPSIVAEFYNDVGGNQNMCGGNRSFAWNMSGLSGQCDVGYMCRMSPLVKRDPLSPGYLKISGNFSAVYNAAVASRKCPGVYFDIYAKNSPYEANATSTTSVAPTSSFIEGIDGATFRVALYDPAGLTPSAYFSTALANASGKLSATSFAKRVGVLNIPGNIYDLVGGTSLTNYREELNADLTQICVLDMFGVKGGSCRFVIPAGATHVDIMVENSNFQSSLNRVTVRITESSAGFTEITNQCGGSRGFVSGTAKDGSCGSFVHCINASVVDEEGGLSYQSVVVFYQSRIAWVQNCPHAGVIKLTTSFQPSNLTSDEQQRASCLAEAGFYCRPRTGYVTDRQCLALSRVCDGKSDCFDSSDEASCSSFTIVEQDKRINEAEAGLTRLVHDDYANSTEDCQRLAIVFSANVYVYNSSNTSCTVYTNTTQTAQFLASPSLLRSAGDIIGARISSTLAYGRCSTAFTCSGSGTAVAARSADNLTFCACICDDSFSGPTCATTNAVGRAQAFVIRATLGATVPLQYAYSFLIAAGQNLGLGSSNIGTSCTPMFFEDASDLTKATLVCYVTSGTISPTASSGSMTAVINGSLSLWLPSVSVSQVFSLPSPGFSPVNTNCTVNATGTNLTLCGFFQPLAMRSIVASASTAVSAASIHVVVTYHVDELTTASDAFAVRRRLGSSSVIQTIDLFCPSVAGYVMQSCFVSSCIFELPAGAVVHTIASGLMYQATNTSVASKDICTSVSIAYNVEMTNMTSSSAGRVDIQNDWSNTSQYWGSSIFIGVVVIACAVIGAALLYSHLSEVARQAELRNGRAIISAALGIVPNADVVDDEGDNEALEESVKATEPLHELVDHVHTVASDDINYSVRRHDCATIGIIVAAIVAIGVVILVWVATIPTFESNYGVVFEQYNTEQCNSDILSSNPVAAFVVIDNWIDCVSREAAGDSAALAPYIAAHCRYGANGQVEVTVKTTFDGSACGAAPVVVVPADTCIPIQRAWSVVSDGSYLIARCAPIIAAKARFDTLAGAGLMLNFVNLSARTAARAPVATLQNTWMSNSSSGLTMQHSRFSGGVWKSLAASAQRFAVVLSNDITGYFVKAAYTGTYQSSIAASYVVQFANESFESPASPFYHPTASSLDVTDNGKLVTSSLVRHVRPFGETQTEFPIGLQFGNFNFSTATIGDSAQSLAQWYYNADANRNLDVGTMYTGVGTMDTTRGFTATVHIQATLDTVGFAFAILDVYENSAQTSPLLTRLYDVVVNSKSSEWWYNEVFNVYFAVLINGPRKQIQVVQAYAGIDVNGNPIEGGREVSVITFNLVTIGQTRLLNGAWHRVDLLVKNLNTGRKEVQLIVDGVTAENKDWVKCMSCDVRSFSRIPEGTSVPVRSSLEEVMTGGVLVVGVLNAGVQGLEIRNGIADIYALRLESSSATQALTVISVAMLIGLGIALAVIAIVGGLYIITASWRRFRANKHLNAHLVYVAATLMYQHCAQHVPALYAYIPSCAGAIRLLTDKCDIDEFIAILEDRERRFKGDGEKMMGHIMSLCYGRHHDKTDDTPNERKNLLVMPSPTEWDAFVVNEDALHVKTIEQKRRHPIGKLRRWFRETFFGTSASFHHSNFVETELENVSPPFHLENDQEREEQRRQEEVHVIAVDHRRNVQAVRNQPWNHPGGGGGRALRSALFEATTGAAGTTGVTGSNGVEGGSTSFGFSDIVSAFESTSVPSIVLAALATSLTPLQFVFMWMEKFVLPTSYLEYFFRFFAVVSGEVSDVFPQINPLATTYFMLAAGLAFACVGIVALYADLTAFSVYVVQYIMRRDAVDPVSRAMRRELIEKVVPLEATANPLDLVNANVNDESAASTTIGNSNISLETYHRIIGALWNWNGGVHDAEKRLSHAVLVKRYKDLPLHKKEEQRCYDVRTVIRVPTDEAEKIHCRTAEQLKFLVTVVDNTTKEATKKTIRVDKVQSPTAGFEEYDFSCEDGATCSIVTSDLFCPVHKDHRLGASFQSDVFPHNHPVQCCMSTDGQICQRSAGQMRVCGKVTFVDGVQHVCQFGVCDQHFRADLGDIVVSDLVGSVRRSIVLGALYVVSTIIFVLANALYAPIIKRATMVVWCHPSMQCALSGCDLANDPKYVVIFVFAVFVLALYGVVYPLCVLQQMLSRKKLLDHAFFADHYGGMYCRRGYRHTPNTNQSPASPLSQRPGSASSSDRPSFMNNNSDTSSQASGASATGVGGVVARLLNTRVLSLKEWSRFVSTDVSAVSYFYRTVTYEFIYFFPLMLFVRAAIVITIVISPSDPFVSHLIVAIAECILLALLCWGGFVSPMVELVYRLGSVHQISLLSATCFDVVHRYHYGTNSDGSTMVAITSIYIAFCVGCVIYALLWTPFRRYWARIQRAALLKKLGLRTGEYHPISIIINEIPQVALSSSVINTVLPDSSEGQDGSAELRPSDEEQTNVWYTARTTPDERERLASLASPSGHASAPASPAAPTGTKDDPSPQLAFTGDDDNDPLVEMTDASPMMDERMTMGASNSNPTGVQSGASHMSSVSTSHNNNNNNNNSSKREKRRLLPN